MDKVTESDFEKVRKWVSLMGQSNDGPGIVYAAKRQAWEEAKPAAAFLVKYYFTTVSPGEDDGTKSPMFTTRPYGSTVTERALIMLNNGWPFLYGEFGSPFLGAYPDLLERAIVHYKQSNKDDLAEALRTTLASMTGSQFLLLLKEHEKQRSAGYPVMMSERTVDGKTTRVYENPHQLIADAVSISNKELAEQIGGMPTDQQNTEAAS